MKQVLPISILVFILIAQVSRGDIPETISYQGVLTDASGTPVADGSYSLTISIYDTETGVAALWSETHSPVTVKSGIFSVILGSSIPLTIDFDEQYWLGVRIGTGPELIPRIPFTSSAYSLNARTVADGAVTTVKLADDAVTGPKLADDVVSTTHILGGTIIGDDIANGMVVRSINLLRDDVTLAAGANVTITPGGNTLTISATSNDAWKLTGNAGTNPATNFLGTTDNQPLSLRVNNLRALRLEPHTISPNLIGGYNDNWVTSGVYGATISGGGHSGYPNSAADHYGTVGGGRGNQAGNDTDPEDHAMFATVGGGMDNKASASAATVAGGAGNKATGYVATVGGGNTNTASQSFATVAGGLGNIASEIYTTVGGGYSNTASAEYATIGGGDGNEVTAAHGTIGGGGMYEDDPNTANRVTDVYGTVSGGGSNQAGNNVDPKNDASCATVSGGWGNVAGATYATVGGGFGNKASKSYTTVGGGFVNEASREDATVGGGSANKASGQAATVSGGESNKAYDNYGTVGGGQGNEAGSDNGNADDAMFATVNGGSSNDASAAYATVAGGRGNEVTAAFGTIGGGGMYTGYPDSGNSVTDEYGTVSGGGQNTAGDGAGTPSDAYCATVGGGWDNMASGKYATIAGGTENFATNSYATVGGGYDNLAYGIGAVVPGGTNNNAEGKCSFAAGLYARAAHDGCFVWSDNTGTEIASTANNEFIVRASGGLWLGNTGSPAVNPIVLGRIIDTSIGAHLNTAGQWVNGSDRAMKRDFAPVDKRDVLNRLTDMPISTWSHIAEGPSIRHMGPVAQDFYAAFGLGRDDRTIGTLDSGGVALAAIQGLYELVKEKDAENAALRQQVDSLEERLKALEALVSAKQGTENDE